MKTKKLKIQLLVSLSLLLAVTATAQINSKYTIVDIYTGETIDLYYDTLTWKSLDKKSNKPVDYYIIMYNDNSLRPDTVHGTTGLIVNDLIWKNAEGKWMFNEARVKWDGNELKMKDKYGRKVKWEEGKLKIKDWNSKYKSEAGDDTKYKEEWDKVKWKDDKMKVENGAQKVKTGQ